MAKDIKPNILASRCLGFEACRYNGDTIPSDFAEKLIPHVNFITPCPEVQIGLGVPRDPVRLVKINKEKRLVQPSTGKDVTEDMKRFTEEVLDSLVDIDGFILKSKSPSCGIARVKVYPAMEKSAPISTNSAGMFSESVIKRFPSHPIEDDGRLRNIIIREHFLTRIFAYARFREVKKSKKISEIVDFHAANKFLFMAYNQENLKEMGKIAANQSIIDFDSFAKEYEKKMMIALSKYPGEGRIINVLMHIYSFFSDRVSHAEKEFFMKMIENYRKGHETLSSIKNLLKSWAIRFGLEYLTQQTFFQPYPEKLFELCNIKKARLE